MADPARSHLGEFVTRPASRAHIELEVAVLRCLEADVLPRTVRRWVEETLWSQVEATFTATECPPGGGEGELANERSEKDQAPTFIEESQGGLVLGEEERERLGSMAAALDAAVARGQLKSDVWEDDAAFLRKLASQPEPTTILCAAQQQDETCDGCPECQPAVEAAAKLRHENSQQQVPWDQLTKAERDEYRTRERPYVEAALSQR